MERLLDPPLDEMVAAHVRGCWAWSESDMLEAYKCQTIVVSSFAKLLGNVISTYQVQNCHEYDIQGHRRTRTGCCP